MTSEWKFYGVLTRFGDYRQVWAHSISEARDITECSIALDCIAGKCEDGEGVHQVQEVPCPIQGVREDLAEIMAK